MPWTIKELAAICGGRAAQSPKAVIGGFKAVADAEPGDLTFVTSAQWLAKLKNDVAAVVPPSLEKAAGKRPTIIADNPRLAFGRILSAVVASKRPEPGIDERAVVHKSAKVGKSVHIGPLAYAGANAKIGARCIIHPGAHIGEDAALGDDCEIHPNAYIGPRCKIGSRVIVGPGASIGHDGFGYQWDGERHVKIPQVGIVVIEDDVEIGALSAIDRAMLGETRIGAGTKIDNLVMIGHNCRIGKNVIIVAQVGLSGSVVVEDGAVLAGQAGVADGMTIGARAIVLGQAGVTKNVSPGAKVGGMPARKETAFLRGQAALDKLPELLKRIRDLEKKRL